MGWNQPPKQEPPALMKPRLPSLTFPARAGHEPALVLNVAANRRLILPGRDVTRGVHIHGKGDGRNSVGLPIWRVAAAVLLERKRDRGDARRDAFLELVDAEAHLLLLGL